MAEREAVTGAEALLALTLMLDLIGSALRAELLAVPSRITRDPKLQKHIEIEMTRAVQRVGDSLDYAVAKIQSGGDAADEIAALRGAEIAAQKPQRAH